MPVERRSSLDEKRSMQSVPKFQGISERPGYGANAHQQAQEYEAPTEPWRRPLPQALCKYQIQCNEKQHPYDWG